MSKPPYTRVYRDRHGKERWQFRRSGHPTVELPGPPGTPGFEEKYEGALRGEKVIIKPGSDKIQTGTIADLIASFIASPEFKNSSQQNRKNISVFLNRLRNLHGEKRVASLQMKHANAILNDERIAPTPTQRPRFLSVLRRLMKLAILMEMRPDDPTALLTAKKPKSDGYKSWTMGNIEQYLAHHPSGSKQRLAMLLALSTAQRRSDVVRMGRQHMNHGKITIRQQKTGQAVSIPIMPELQHEIDLVPKDQLTFLVTNFGKPFQVAGFGNWFKAACIAAGLEDIAMHGLRKARASQLAEAGATSAEIAAILGHHNHSEAEPYVREADRIKMAESGMKRLSK